MNPLDALLESMGETAVRRAYGPDVVNALRALIRDLMGLPMFAPLVAMLRRDTPGAETMWRFIGNWVRPSRALRGRPLPGGITPRLIDEMWEEAVMGARAAVMAAPPAPPAGPGAPPAPTAPGAPAPTPAEPGLWDRLKTWFEIRLLMVPIILSAIWAWVAGISLVFFAVFSAFILRAEKLSLRRLYWFHEWVIAESRPWLKCARLLTLILIAAVVLTLVRAILGAARERFVDRRWLVLPVILAGLAIPVSALALTAGLDVVILTARIADAPLHYILPFITKADRYAMWFVTPSLAGLMLFTGVIFAIDKVVDISALIAQRFGVGKGNIPLEAVARALRGFGISILAGLAVLHLAVARWPSAQQVMDFLLYGVGLVVLSGIILAWAGIQSSPRVRKWVGIGFVGVFTATTLYVWYKGRHAGVLGAAADQTAEIVLAHRPWYERAWHWVSVTAWGSLTSMHWIPGAVLGSVAILLFVRAIDRATGGAKGLSRVLWALAILPTAFVVAGIVAGWLPEWASWTPPWANHHWHW